MSRYLSQDASTVLDGTITYDSITEGVGHIHFRDFRPAEQHATAALEEEEEEEEDKQE